MELLTPILMWSGLGMVAYPLMCRWPMMTGYYYHLTFLVLCGPGMWVTTAVAWVAVASAEKMSDEDE